MHRTLFHSLVAVFAAGVLLLQHAPLVQTGHGEHEHCIHCTGNYCTKAECDCGHAHRRPQHDPSAAPAHADHNAASHQHKAHDHDAVHEPADEAPRTDAVDTALKTCGAPPSGIITITLDKFIGRAATGHLSSTIERPSSARYVGGADQLVVDQIFHPPVSRI